MTTQEKIGQALIENFGTKNYQTLISKMKKEPSFSGVQMSTSWKGKGIRLTLTNNPNALGGKKNGYGPGLYVEINCTGFCREILLKQI